jgi:sulfate adenylyltransferase subunit 2
MNDYSNLDRLESESIYIIREAYWLYRERLACLWSCGKDSTTMIHLLRKAFLGQIPIPIIHLDTTFKFEEIYKFRDKYAKELNLKLIISKNQQALKHGMSPNTGREMCCTALKTDALKLVIKKYGLQALLLAIRRDEHTIRAKERVFSPRDSNFAWNYFNQPLEMWNQFYKFKNDSDIHIRIHPLLGWREIDIWRYIKREKIPVINLYFAKRGKRYRSIGCECCCQAINSRANTIDKIITELKTTQIAERSGRAQDKEHPFMMQKLRSLGYM